jgi:hypothetical protein
VAREGAVSAWLDGVVLFANVSLRGWAPQTTWRVGLHGAMDDALTLIWVDNLQVAALLHS